MIRRIVYIFADVDNGDTVMDYLKVERERGITINAAAITFGWKDHTINLYAFHTLRKIKHTSGTMSGFLSH
jgi:translation elongation factor EF-G